MRGIDTLLQPKPPEGELRPAGMVHGALNYLLVPHSAPEDWEFKQFISEKHVQDFAMEHNLTLLVETPDE